MARRPNAFHLVLVVLGGACAVPAVSGEEGRPPAPPRPQSLSRLEGLQIQETDEPLRTFSPRRQTSEAEKRRAQALAHFAAGRLQQESRKRKAALQSYRKAIELDPASLPAYQAALPILLQEGDIKQARELSLNAARHGQEGFKLVATMAALFAQQNRLGEGITLLHQALEIPGLKPQSAQKLSLHRDLGLFYRLSDDVERAAEQYKLVFDAVTGGALDESVRSQILQEPGKNFDEFGDTFLKAKQPELALRAYEEASKHREEKPGLHSFNLATVFHQTDDPEKALEELQKYFDAQLQTRGRGAYDLLKELLAEVGKSEEFVPRLEKIYEKDPHNEVLRFYLADEVLAAGDLGRAEMLYRNGRETLSDPRALVGMIAVHRQRREPEQLLKVLTQAFQTVPRGDDEQVLQQLASDVRDLSQRFETELTALKEDQEAIKPLFEHAKSLQEGDDAKLDFFQAYVLGKMATEGDHTDEAIHFYRLAISMRNDPPGLLFTELGTHLLDAQRHDEAIEVLNEALNHPSNALQRERWRFLFFLSYALEFAGQTDQALQAIREAQQINPNFNRLFYHEAWIVYHARQWDAALELFEKFTRDYATDTDLVRDARFRISNIYVEKGDMEQGEKILEEILKADPANTQANNDLGYLWADQGKNLEKSRKMIGIALEAEPENPAYLDSMGWVLYRLEKYEEALPYLQKATEQKHGNDGTIYDHLGDCLEKLGRAEEARAAWKKALELEREKKAPTEKLVKSLQEKLGDDVGEARSAREPEQVPEGR